MHTRITLPAAASAAPADLEGRLLEVVCRQYPGRLELRVGELARALGISSRSVHYLIEQGQLHTIDCTFARGTAVTLVELVRYLVQAQRAADARRPPRKGKKGRPATRRPRAPRPVNRHEQLREWLAAEPRVLELEAQELFGRYVQWAAAEKKSALPMDTFRRALERFRQKNGGAK